MPVEHVKILLAYDGSECANAAMDDLPLAGLPAKVDAVVVSVAEAWQQLPPEVYRPLDPGRERELGPTMRSFRVLAAQALEEAKSLAAQGAERLRRRFPGWSVRPEARGGSAYAEIVTLADEVDADLVVVGSHGRSAPGRFVLGSVSQNVLAHAPCSVRVARRRDDPGRLTDDPPRVLVGVDGSPDSALAISAVATRDWPKGTAAKVVTAIDPWLAAALVGVGAGGAQAHALAEAGWSSGRTWAAEAADRAATELRDAGLAATAVVEQADPKRALIKAAEAWKADTIFVGAKGHSRLERFLLGSVSAAVAARAGCSVEVVRQG